MGHGVYKRQCIFSPASFASKLLLISDVMLVIPRRSPKLYKGFKVILEDGTPEKIERRSFNGFKIVEDTDDVVDMDKDEQIEIEKTEKRKGGDTPTKRIKLV